MVFVAAEEGEGDFRCYKEGGKRPQFRGGKERGGGRSRGDAGGNFNEGLWATYRSASGRSIHTHKEELATLCNIASGTNLYYPRGGGTLLSGGRPLFTAVPRFTPGSIKRDVGGD